MTTGSDTGNENELMVDRILLSVDLLEFGVKLMRQNIQRANPDATKKFVDSEMQRWLIEQPLCFTPKKFTARSR